MVVVVLVAVSVPACVAMAAGAVVAMGTSVCLPVGVVMGVSTAMAPGVPMPIGMTVTIVSGVIVSMPFAVRMTTFRATLLLRNPLRMGVSAGSAVFVTVSFGVAGVTHGGFLAGFVV